MLKMALDLLVHGLQHFINGEPLDLRLAILHVDQSVELTLKERVRVGGVPVMKPGGKESISLLDAYSKLNDLEVVIHERTNLDLLHEQRNQIQHLFSSPDINTTRFHIDNTLFFLARFLSEELSIILLDYIPAEVLANDKLKHIEDIDKLRLLYESAESNYKAKKYSEGISSLVAAVDLTIQYASEKKDIKVSASTSEELLMFAEDNKVISKRAIGTAKKIIELNKDDNFISENDFLALLAKYRSEVNI